MSARWAGGTGTPVRLTAEQRAARESFAEAVRAADPSVRVTVDVEGWPIVPGRLGRVEPFCDGDDGHAWPGPMLAVYTPRSTLVSKLLGVPGVRQWQLGDREGRVIVPTQDTGALAAVFRLIGVRRRRVKAGGWDFRDFRPRAASRSAPGPENHAVVPGAGS